MSPRKSLSLLLAAAPPLALGAEPLYTDPVGFVKLGNTAGGSTPAVAANTDVWLSVPLERELSFSGTVTSTSGNTITVNGSPGWETDAWYVATGSGAPYCLIVTSGSEDGLRGIINKSTSDSITVQEPFLSPGTVANLSVGDKIEIRPCWTVKDLFKDSNLPPQTKIFLFEDQAAGINHSPHPQDIFNYNGSNWKNAYFQNRDDFVVRPGEAFVLRSPDVAIPSLTMFGDVAKGNLKVEIYKDGGSDAEEDLELAMTYPVPVLLKDLDLPVEPGDRILYLDNVATGLNKSPAPHNVLRYSEGPSGGVWKNAYFQDVTNSFTVSPGTGFKLRRASSSSLSAIWTQPSIIVNNQ